MRKDKVSIGGKYEGTVEWVRSNRYVGKIVMPGMALLETAGVDREEAVRKLHYLVYGFSLGQKKFDTCQWKLVDD